MPTINKPPKKEKSTFHSDTPERALRQQLYNNRKWRACRISYLKEHPICEKCLSKGIVNAGTKEYPLSIHHRKSPFQNGAINWELAFDANNLMTLCQQCHAEEHNYQNQDTPEQIIEKLDDLLNGSLEKD